MALTARCRSRRALCLAGGVAGAAAAAAATYALVVRPRLLRWGATGSEIVRRMPGDELVPRARIESTRAVTIHAPAERVWAWLVQIGQGRGGYYSYDWLENLAGLDIHSAERIVPELQHLAPGDTVRVYPGGGFTVSTAEPGRALVLQAAIDAFSGKLAACHALLEGALFQTSWAFTLKDLGAGYTRLAARFRADYLPRLANLAFAHLLLEPAVFVMERKILLGIKARAER